jgi:3-hydroxybutyryl-CoA dehydrogenase
MNQNPIPDAASLVAPSAEAIHRVTVIGSGTMGNGIAQVFATCGFQVQLVDLSTPALDKAMETIARNLDRMLGKGLLDQEARDAAWSRIQCNTGLASSLAQADLVVEAATENRQIKLELFRQLDQLCLPHCVLATNTSSISITDIAGATSRPGMVIGMHFMNPVPVMKLVEIIKGYNTTPAVTAAVVEVSKKLGKTPVEAHDYPGFVANRILMPMINEAIHALYEQVAGVLEIDTVMKLGMAHPMGPLQLADFIGLDVCLAILRVLHDGFGQPKYAPCPLLVKMVSSGNLGVKSGKGFYTYRSGSKELVVAPEFT